MDTLYVKFDVEDIKEAGKLITELQQFIKEATDETLQVLKEDKHSQDGGAILILLLGTPGVIAVINAIRDYVLSKNKTITIETKDKKVIATGLSSKDIPKVFDEFRKD